MKQLKRAIAGAALLALSGAASALTFNFTFLAGTSAQAQQAFIDAGARWSALYSDNITLDMTVGTAALGAGIPTSSASRRASFSYTKFKSALTGDINSADDATAVGSLFSIGGSFGLLINRTADNPNGNGSATPYLDLSGANNTTIHLTTANAKALGLAPGTGMVGNCVSTCDASITLSNTFAFDFNPSDGITAGQFDLVDIAAREIDHALGFVSGVDVLDVNSPPLSGPFFADVFTRVTSLDLFRYSALSLASGVIDFTADTRSKYFSITGGLAVGPAFSTGIRHGDGQEAGHWKDSLGLGIMDPTAGSGELLAIGTNDRMVFDVIGWNLVSAVPEPGTWALFGAGLLGIAARRRLARQST